MSRENQICGILDLQGFWIDKMFYPRELSFVNDYLRLCYEIEIDINKAFKCKNARFFSFQQHQLHGLPVETVLNERTKKVFHISQLRTLIEELYYRVRSEQNPLLGVKNQQLSKILEEYEIPYFNFENELIGHEICPALCTFDKFKNSQYCLLHSSLNIKKTDHRCSLRKSTYIWAWLKDKLISDNLIDEISSKLESVRQNSYIKEKV